MFRIYPYILLFLTAAMLQIFVFDNLTITPLLSPLVYLVFIILLPIEIPPLAMIALGTTLGVVMDWTMGVAGINTIATLFVSFFRANILSLICGKERTNEKGVPSELLLGYGDFIRYIVTMVVIQHVIYFAFESLSITNLWFLAMRFTLSTALGVLFVWLIARMFTLKSLLK